MTATSYVDQLDAAADLLTGDHPEADSEPGPENIYLDVVPFVTEYLGPLYARTWAAGRELHWCDQWWAHPEAVVRLTALWLSWEAARLQPDGVLGWLRDADANIDRLTLSTGTFSQCGPPPPQTPAATAHQPAARPPLLSCPQQRTVTRRDPQTDAIPPARWPADSILKS